MNTCVYTQRNIYEILLNQTKISLYLPFYDWFGTQTVVSVCVPNQSICVPNTSDMHFDISFHQRQLWLAIINHVIYLGQE